jgi:hypothetical protein
MAHILNRSSSTLPSASLPQLLECSPLPQEGIWVRLLERPNAWSFEEALLLCQKSEYEWLAWIPDYGEATIHLRQFCAPR